MNIQVRILGIYIFIMASFLLQSCSSSKNILKMDNNLAESEYFSVKLSTCKDAAFGSTVYCNFYVTAKKGKEICVHSNSIRGQSSLILYNGRGITATGVELGVKKRHHERLCNNTSQSNNGLGRLTFENTNVELKEIVGVEIAVSRTVLHKAEIFTFRGKVK